ncbi:hypothetical protein UUU_11170 [Klebsiella pneumoniae subsp. pneumoniae DSM 30104 = JCM 1662 = NBRC 14940]|nr:hypothetical protein UUU_11170 [Klebsiella pneumoniae subsp. pneumoniae DSM 30104 = JCM 1662 = NBRC 14940]
MGIASLPHHLSFKRLFYSWQSSASFLAATPATPKILQK